MNETFIMQSCYDGLGISVLMTKPESQPAAVLQLAHGMRGCKERFLPFMSYMAEHGVLCVANDHRGHGDSVISVEDRGYMYSGGYLALVDDMRMLTVWLHMEYPTLPVFILGQSMGSLAVKTYLKQYDSLVDGVVLCGNPGSVAGVDAGLALSHFLCMFNDGRFRPVLMQRLASMSYNWNFRDEGVNAWTCTDPGVRNDFASNPSCSYDFTSNGLHALVSMMKESCSREGWNVSHPDLPIYFISGADDPCMRGEKSFHKAAQHLADLGYVDVTSAIYPVMRHEVLNEIGKEVVWEDILEHIISWI